MSSSVLYFTAGPVPTSAELAEIAVLNGIAAAPYTVAVRNGKPRASVTLKTVAAVASDNSYTDAGATITAGTISAAASDNSLNDSGNGFLNAGFAAGDYVSVSGFSGAGATANIITNAKVLSVTAAKMILDPGDGAVLVDDAATESVTITAGARFIKAGFKAGDHIMVRGFSGAGDPASNLDDGVVTSVTATKLILAGSDGDGIVADAAGEAVTICTIDDSVLYGAGLEVADYIAGTVPEAYKSAGTAIYTVLDPANPPDAPTLIDTQTVLSSGETIPLDTAGTVTVTVAAGAIATADVAATEAVVTHGDTLSVDGSDVTLSVVAHALTGALAATKCVVTTADTVTVDGSTVTLTVAGNAITGGALAATKCVVTTGDVVTAHTHDVTLTVAGNAVTGGALAATKAIVIDGQEIPITGGVGTKVTITVAGNAITACVQS